ncbi:MAG: hypothetical protein ABSC42_16750 [Tepidisphaeraceae bacterium]|jgi:hypothetical protein
MTSEDIRAELERQPFIPFRLHMVSGKTLDVTVATSVALLQNAMCILEPPVDVAREGDYNVASMRNIERLERLHKPRD